MALDSKITIKYGDFTVGGTLDTYQIDGAYTLDKAFDTLRLVFNVVVVGIDHDDGTNGLHKLSDDLETAFRKRDQTLIITLGTTPWTYTHGVDLLTVSASCSKTGNAETDRGASRAYTIVVEGQLPADDAAPENGLRDIGFNVDIEAGRQHVLTMQGVYTATSAESEASENYLDPTTGADAEATTFLGTFPGKTFELVDEQYSPDRLNHTCSFARQYVELLANQSQGLLDDTEIRDHRITFSDVSQHPGDSQESVYRLRKVITTYDCAVDIDQTTNLQQVFDIKILPHITALFELNFTPTVFATEDRRVSYDETSKRISVSITFIYQKDGGSDVLEVQQSSAFRELRNIDYTPLHNKNELAAEAATGWVILEKVSTRTVVIIGSISPIQRLSKSSSAGTSRLPTFSRVGGGGGASSDVKRSGWNLISSTSQVTPQWIGDPDQEQLKISVLTEDIVERFNKAP